MTAPVVFIDTETTGLDPDRHEIWEVGLIEADGTEHHWFLPVDLGRADPYALKVGHFYERYPDYQRHNATEPWVTDIHALWLFARQFAQLTAGAHLCGAVVSFDEERLRKLLRANGACPDWSHRTICVETLAAGHLKLAVPIGLRRTAELLNLKVDESALHTALGDARLAKAIFDAVMKGGV